MRLTAAVQEALLAILYYDSTNASAVAALVPPKLYDPFFSELAEAGIEYLREYGQPPGEHDIDLLNSLSERHPKKAEFFRRIHGSLVATRGGINHKYVLDQAGAFVRYQRLKRGLASAISSLEKENEEGLLEAERTLGASLKQSFDLFDPGTFLSDPDRAVRFMDSELFEAIPTGIPALDRRNLGPARGRFHLFTAPAKAGKSWWLVNLAKQALMHQKRVLYVTLELSEEEVCARLFQSLFSMTKRSETVRVQRFERDELGRFVGCEEKELRNRPYFEDPNVREFLAAKQAPLKHRPPLLVRQFPSLSTDQLEGYLDMLESQHRYIPDLLLIDYITLLETDPRNYRISIGNNARKTRAIAIERNLALATASQTNREGSKSRWVTKEHTGEDLSLAQTADVQLTYNQTQEEHELGLARIFVAAGRSDADKFTVLISQSYNMGQFVVDTVGYTSDWWSALEDMTENKDRRPRSTKVG